MAVTLSTPRQCMQPNALRSVPRFALYALLWVVAILGVPRAAVAQESPASAAVDVFRKVALDPTTYAPSLIAYDATIRDWNTSQVFFAHGFHERNERFTISGLPNDTPIGYAAGRRRIAGDALATLRVSVVQNLTSHVVEDVIARRFPEHRRLVKTLGWIERASLASYMSYRLSVKHYRQTQYNDALAQSLGYR